MPELPSGRRPPPLVRHWKPGTLPSACCAAGAFLGVASFDIACGMWLSAIIVLVGAYSGLRYIPQFCTNLRHADRSPMEPCRWCPALAGEDCR